MHMGRVGEEVAGEASGSVDRWGGRWVVRAGGRTGWRESGGSERAGVQAVGRPARGSEVGRLGAQSGEP